MGDGLKRAKAAAEATQITEAQRDLLLLIAPRANGADRYCLPEATRENDRVRQACRKAGWIEYRFGRWFMTPAGRAVLGR